MSKHTNADIRPPYGSLRGCLNSPSLISCETKLLKVLRTPSDKLYSLRVGNLFCWFNFLLFRYEQAEVHYTRSLAIRQCALGPRHPDVALSLNNLAALFSSVGRLEEAAPLFQVTSPPHFRERSEAFREHLHAFREHSDAIM
jgi:hypothetical protein